MMLPLSEYQSDRYQSDDISIVVDTPTSPLDKLNNELS